MATTQPISHALPGESDHLKVASKMNGVTSLDTTTMIQEVLVSNVAADGGPNTPTAEVAHTVDAPSDMDDGAEATSEDVRSADAAETGKAPHPEKPLMERLGAAIKKVMSAGLLEARSLDPTAKEKEEPRFILVFKVLLREWYCKELEVLADIEGGNLTVTLEGSGFIHPDTWEQVIEQGDTVQVWPHSSYTTPDESVKIEEKECENRIQYVVDYYEIGTTNGTCYAGQRTFDQPVKFEVIDDHERLPALQEVKCVQVQRYQDVGEGKDEADKKKARLGIHDRVTTTLLKINSQHLLNVLRSVVDYAVGEPDGEAYGLGPGVFEYPYQVLYYHMSDLLRYKSDDLGSRIGHSDDVNQKRDEHIDLLDQHLKAQPDVPLKECEAQWSRKTPVTTFATYWLLLQPGSDVYVRESNGFCNVYVVHEVLGGVAEEDGKKVNYKYEVSVWNLAFDGTHVVPSMRVVEINVFDNEREIVGLPLFPVRFIDQTDGGKRRAALIDRGKRYVVYSKRPSFLQYSGTGLREAKTYKRARVIVTHAAYPWDEFTTDHRVPEDCTMTIRQYIRVPRYECIDCRTKTESQEVYAKERFSDYCAIEPSEDPPLLDHQYMLMASHMYAFELKDRRYDLLMVEGLEEPDMADTAIQRLVMDDKTKDMIKAIARTYTDGQKSDRFHADFIHGKGEGQIILLHGPPGTGKTLTAESIAEFTRRPLLSIAAADLGHEPMELERNLLRYFRMASDWDAIVLLDEADVYLEQRTTHDLQRNSIVSVFLRALDYFTGILFLTTNRVGQFEEAFLSRIHVSLGYEKLDDAAREQIWQNLFDKLGADHERGGPKIVYDYDAKCYAKSKDVQSLEWNGREIRNAFQTAVALALYDSKHKNSGTPPKIFERHLKQVVSMSAAFRKYMVAAHSGMDDSTWAFKHGNREDKFPSTPGK